MMMATATTFRAVVTMEQGTDSRSNLRPWQRGQSGNPSGRRKTKPITSVILAALKRPMYPGDPRTMAQCFKDRLAQIIMSGEDQHSIAAFRMLMEYTEGKPQQSVTIDFDKALDEVAVRSGAPKLWLMKRSQEIALRHGREGDTGGDDDGQPDGPVYLPADTYRQPGDGVRQRTGGRIRGVKVERTSRAV